MTPPLPVRPEPPPRDDPYGPLRRPAFRRYVGGSLAANIANQILRVAAGYHLYKVTHSAWSLALVGLMSYAPIPLLSLPAGWASDHRDRRGVLAAALGLQAAAALGLALLTALGGAIWGWYPLLFLAACGRAIQSPAAASLYPLLIEESEVPRGVSWQSANHQAGAVLGPLAGGLLLRFGGLFAALGFVLAGPLLYLALLPGVLPRRAPPAPRIEPMRDKLLGGFRFVRDHKAILGALTVDFVAVLFGGVEGILPMFALDILHCGALGQGALTAAPFVGSLAMGFRLAHRPRLRRPGRAMLLAVAGFGVCILVFGLSRDFTLSVLALAVAGVMDQISVFVRQTLVQLGTPEALRGRVQAVNFLFIGSSNELGECESALTATVLGPVGSTLLGGAAVLGVVLAATRLFPDLLALPSLERGGRREGEAA